MSRGPGRIETAIERLFTTSPEKTFSTDELVMLVYPAIKRVEKKHRVAVLRAADKVAERLHWEKWQCERLGWGHRWPGTRQASLRGRGAIYFNQLDVWSYAQARLRVNFHNGAQSEEEWNARLGQGGDHHKYIVPGGAWWIQRTCTHIPVSH